MKHYLLSLSCLGLLLSACTSQPTSVNATGTPSQIPSPPEHVTPLAQDMITGIVRDENGPVAGATVRIQATDNSTFTDSQGSYRLNGLQSGQAVTVSAWKEGYYCAKLDKVSSPDAEVNLALRPYQINDNPAYQWIPPTGENSCYSCKPGVTQVWLDNDAHGKSAVNPRFLTMYNGSDMAGNQSPPTRFTTSRDYGRLPIPPDFSKPYYGPGYKLDFPDTAGNCAACHIPGAAVDAAYGIDPNQVNDVNKFGIHCDFCHKIAAVKLDPSSGLPYPNMPGVLSMDIRRPFPEDKQRYQIFFGTFDDDNVPQEDTYLPLIKESRFCAPCHFGVFWNTLIYNSYGEWLESPYSNPQTGKTCQNCHTPAPTLLDGKPLTNVAPEKGGVERDPNTIYAHTFPGAMSTTLLQNSVTMRVQGRWEGDQVMVEVNITNDKTGHHIPSDSPLRHLILLVQASDANGKPLAQLEGPTVPEWGGVGDAQRGYYAGLPGKAFAKVLLELWTEIFPTGAYWNPTQVLSDNRLAAFATDTSQYVFAAPQDSAAKIEVKLFYRRAYIKLIDQKDWDVPDILMESETLELSR